MEHNPLGHSNDAFLGFVQSRQLRIDGIICVGHFVFSELELKVLARLLTVTAVSDKLTVHAAVIAMTSISVSSHVICLTRDAKRQILPELESTLGFLP